MKSKSKVTKEETPDVPSIKGNFYYLQCSKAAFDELPKPVGGAADPRGNIVFKYFIQAGKFTLRGWSLIGRTKRGFKFDPLPNIAFEPTTVKSKVTYGNLTSLGDFLLSKRSVKSIEKALKVRKHGMALFMPHLSDEGTVVWLAGTTMDKFSDIKGFEPVEGVDLAPIPPKRYDK